jgi:hypothetical protein
MMVYLQYDIQTLFENSSLWFIIEVIVIIIIIIYQFKHYRKGYKNINLLRNIFKDRLYVKSGYIDREILDKENVTAEDIVLVNKDEITPSSGKNFVRFSVTKTSGTNDTIWRIKNAINTYLLSNYGAAVNFSIIKDIIDREVDLKDDEITQAIPTPLYLGLAATMVGIIFGLMSMSVLNGDKFALEISSLINGVRFAMISSLLGLSFTTHLSSFRYKDAKLEILSDKNEQISYLQAKLLPELIKAEDTGVSGLKASLDRFALVATNISDNVLIAANKTSENISMQQEVLTKIGNLDMQKISKVNLDLFNRLESNMSAFNKFSEYVLLMSQISDNLKEFASRTVNIDKIVTRIDDSLQKNSRLSEFLTLHFEKIESAGLAAGRAVDFSHSSIKSFIENLTRETEDILDQAKKSINSYNSQFSDAIEKLKNEIDNRISQLNQDASGNESKLTELYNEIGTKLDLITSKHLSELQTAYSNAIPQFRQLDQLEYLPKIQESFSANAANIKNDNNNNVNKLIDSVNQLNASLDYLKNRSENNAILNKLDLIEDQLKRRRNRSIGMISEKEKSENKPEVTFWKRIRKPFRFFTRKK